MCGFSRVGTVRAVCEAMPFTLEVPTVVASISGEAPFGVRDQTDKGTTPVGRTDPEPSRRFVHVHVVPDDAELPVHPGSQKVRLLEAAGLILVWRRFRKAHSIEDGTGGAVAIDPYHCHHYAQQQRHRRQAIEDTSREPTHPSILPAAADG